MIPVSQKFPIKIYLSNFPFNFLCCVSLSQVLEEVWFKTLVHLLGQNSVQVDVHFVNRHFDPYPMQIPAMWCMLAPQVPAPLGGLVV